MAKFNPNLCVRSYAIKMTVRAILWLLVMAGFWPQAAHAQTAFSCTGDIYQVQSGQLRIFDPITSTYRNIGPVQTGYNAMGYSSRDNLLYAIQTRNLIRVDATGAVTILFPLPFNSSSADMDDSDNLWIQRSGTLITRFNVLTGSSSDLTLTGGIVPGGAVDIAFVTTASGDRIVAMGTSEMSLTDPVTGVTTTKTVASYPNEGSSGATWADATGRVFTFKNNTGNVYELKDYLTASPYAMLVAVGVPSSSNDGASCRSRPFPNLAPLAAPDSFSTPIQTVLNGNVMANNGSGVDTDPEGSPITAVTPPVNGVVVLSSDGSFTYTPNAGFSGTDSFQYRVRDISGLTATALVTITVTNAKLTVQKSSSLYAPAASFPFKLPGNDLVYAIAVTNIGQTSARPDSLFVLDTIPAELEFFNGDIDTGGPDSFPGNDPVAWVDAASALRFAYAGDVAFSDILAAPTSFAACSYVPMAGYDRNVRHICLNPKGAMASGGSATFYFRMRIK